MRVAMGDIAQKDLVYGFGMSGLGNAVIYDEATYFDTGSAPVYVGPCPSGVMDPNTGTCVAPLTGDVIGQPVGPSLPSGCDPVLGCPPDSTSTGPSPSPLPMKAPGQIIAGISNNVLLSGAIAVVVVLILTMGGGRR